MRIRRACQVAALYTPPVPSPAHILVVDDNADLRGAMALLLESEGHGVVEAGDGRQALEALSAGPAIGVVILDLMMPVMDGPAFLAHKATGNHASVPVVIFSSSPCVGVAGWARGHRHRPQARRHPRPARSHPARRV